MPSGVVELDGDAVPGVDLDAIDRGVDPAAFRIAHDDDGTGADERPAVLAMPVRGRELAEIDIAAAHRIFLERRLGDLDGPLRRKRLALAHPGLERIERLQCGI